MSVAPIQHLPDQMQAAVFYAPGEVKVESVAFPSPGAGEMTIAVGAALTCGTDVKTYRRGHPVLIKKTPSLFGHECAGTVVNMGDGVTEFAIGDRVVAANSAPCRDCFYCKRGNPNLCDHLDLLNGAYAQYLKIPERIVRLNTLKLPQNVSFEAAAFCEPLAVCIRGIEACGIHPGDRVAVLGLGAIGLFMMRLAKQKGATVIGFGRNPLKCQMAKAFAHADGIVELSEALDIKQIQKDHTNGYGFDVVIEAVGLPVMWEQAIALVRRGGLVNLFGGCARGTAIQVDTARLHYDEIRLISLFHHTPNAFRQALEMIAGGQLDPTPLITEAAQLDDVIASLEKVAVGKAIKIAIHPWI